MAPDSLRTVKTCWWSLLQTLCSAAGQVAARHRLASPLVRVGQEDAGKDGERAGHGSCNAARQGFLPGHGRFEAGRRPRPVLASAQMAKIGELLIRGGHLTPDGLEEALDWQVLYGCRLGTNLLELELVEEEQLARALGKQLGAEVAWGELQVDPALVSAVPKHIADRQEMVPWKLEKRRLKVLCCEIKVGELDQLSYKVGRTCVPVIAPEFRVFQLLRLHYQATRQMRALDFGVVPEEGRRKKPKGAEKTLESTPELIDENAFNEIYNRIIPAGPGATATAPEPGMRATQPSPALTPITPRQPPPEEEELESLPEDAILQELPADAITEPVRLAAAALVVKTRSHYMGPLQKTPANIRFLATLGKKVPLSALIFPILHRGRVSHMLYLDNGHKRQAPTDVGEMLILSQRIGQTVEALVERKRKSSP